MGTGCRAYQVHSVENSYLYPADLQLETVIAFIFQGVMRESEGTEDFLRFLDRRGDARAHARAPAKQDEEKTTVSLSRINMAQSSRCSGAQTLRYRLTGLKTITQRCHSRLADTWGFECLRHECFYNYNASLRSEWEVISKGTRAFPRMNA